MAGTTIAFIIYFIVSNVQTLSNIANMSDQVYICIPMYPEGDPSSDASQEILYWQHCTMAAMYQRVAAAIQAVGSEAHPQDYLNFYCLGKRESEQELPEGLDTPEEGSLVERVRQSLRHPVYVHSKLMVVDDTHIVLGSANINQRSLDGHRDSEICLHGHQPARGAAGGVRVFREALWAAHTGGRHPQLAEPGTQVRRREMLIELSSAISTSISYYTQLDIMCIYCIYCVCC